MLSIEEIDRYIKENLLENRYIHTLGVVETAIRLAEINGADKEKARVAAMAHDIAKNMSIYDLRNILEKNSIVLTHDEEQTPELWHSMASPILGREILKIEDEEILGAMRWHTTGKENMNLLEKIIYIADMIEPGRKFPGVEKIRRTTFKDLNEGLIEGMTHSIKYLLDIGSPVNINSINARNYLLLNK